MSLQSNPDLLIEGLAQTHTIITNISIKNSCNTNILLGSFDTITLSNIFVYNHSYSPQSPYAIFFFVFGNKLSIDNIFAENNIGPLLYASDILAHNISNCSLNTTYVSLNEGTNLASIILLLRIDTGESLGLSTKIEPVTYIDGLYVNVS